MNPKDITIKIEGLDRLEEIVARMEAASKTIHLFHAGDIDEATALRLQEAFARADRRRGRTV